MAKTVAEWLKQADYDLATAEHMFNGGRFIYAVFMCHLCVEKALKGIYHGRLSKYPPKTHNLVYLLNEIGVSPPEEFGRFMVKLSEASIPTRYPESLDEIQKLYTGPVTTEIIEKTKGTLSWIKGLQ